MQNASVLLLIVALFTWQFYKHRKAIIHNMKLYGNYFASVMREKVDEKQRMNKEDKNGKKRFNY